MQQHLKQLKRCCKLFYVSIYIALCSTESKRPVSLKVLEVNIIWHKHYVIIPSYQIIVSSIKFKKKRFAKFMIPIVLFKKFLS